MSEHLPDTVDLASTDSVDDPRDAPTSENLIHPTSIDSLAKEILIEIFQLYLSAEPHHDGFPTSSIALTHVCAKWRSMVRDLPELWTKLTFRLSHISNPCLAMLPEFLACSRARSLELTINLRVVDEPSTALVSAFISIIGPGSFWRLSHLSIVAWPEFFEIVGQVMKASDFPLLQSVKFGVLGWTPNLLPSAEREFQVDHWPMMTSCHLEGYILPTFDGFNPASLAHLTVKHSMINWIRNGNDIVPTVTLPSIREFNAEGVKFRVQTAETETILSEGSLVSLKLHRIVMTRTNNAITVDAAVRFFDSVDTRAVETLDIAGLLNEGVRGFALALQSEPPRFPRCTSLAFSSFRSLPLAASPQSFALAFPSVTHLTLRDIDPAPILAEFARVGVSFVPSDGRPTSGPVGRRAKRWVRASA
ncbi:hypothetical protein PLICRDRAFT_612350 [Plicaturopsis crispa FD-325 SS-3]|nr:hypothetical protein PLICRDRAFT_612350 [Plicaturopsis crispa FD-325 SS-3]